MQHYVYIIFSKSSNIYYKGESINPYSRLASHNSNLSEFTSGKGPWELVYVEAADNRAIALKREKAIKKLNRRSIEKLIMSKSNLLLKK